MPQQQKTLCRHLIVPGSLSHVDKGQDSTGHYVVQVSHHKGRCLQVFRCRTQCSHSAGSKLAPPAPTSLHDPVSCYFAPCLPDSAPVASSWFFNSETHACSRTCEYTSQVPALFLHQAVAWLLVMQNSTRAMSSEEPLLSTIPRAGVVTIGWRFRFSLIAPITIWNYLTCLRV